LSSYTFTTVHLSLQTSEARQQVVQLPLLPFVGEPQFPELIAHPLQLLHDLLQ